METPANSTSLCVPRVVADDPSITREGNEGIFLPDFYKSGWKTRFRARATENTKLHRCDILSPLAFLRIGLLTSFVSTLLGSRWLYPYKGLMIDFPFHLTAGSRDMTVALWMIYERTLYLTANGHHPNSSSLPSKSIGARDDRCA